METMKTTALHPTQTKSITSGITCTGSANNADEITTRKEDQLFSGTSKDSNGEDSSSKDNLDLRVSDDHEAEQDGASVLANLDKKGTKATDQVSKVPVKPAAGTESSKNKEVERIFGEEKIGVVNSVKLTQEAQQSGNFSVDDKKMNDRHLYDADKNRTSADTVDYKGSSCINNSYSPMKRFAHGNRWSYPNEMHNRPFYNGRIENMRDRYHLKNRGLLSDNSVYNNRYYNVMPNTRNRGISRRNPHYNNNVHFRRKYQNPENFVKTQIPVTESQDKLSNRADCRNLSKTLPTDLKNLEDNGFIIINEVTDNDRGGNAQLAATQNENYGGENGDLSDVEKKLKDRQSDGESCEEKSKEGANVDAAPLDSSKELNSEFDPDGKKAVKINEIVDSNCPVNNADVKVDTNVNSMTENSKDVSDLQNGETDKLASNDTTVKSHCNRERTISVNIDNDEIVTNDIKVASDICTKVIDEVSGGSADTLDIEIAKLADQEKTDETAKNIQKSNDAVLSLGAKSEENEKQRNSVEAANKNLDNNTIEILGAEDENAKAKESCDNDDKKMEVNESEADDKEKVILAIGSGVEDVEKNKGDIKKSEGASSTDASIRDAKEKSQVSSSTDKEIAEKLDDPIGIKNAENNQDDASSRNIEPSDKNNVEKKVDLAASENSVLGDTDKNAVEAESTKIGTDSPSKIRTHGSSIQNGGRNSAVKRRRRKRPKRKVNKRKLAESAERKSVTKKKTPNSEKKNNVKVNTRKDEKSVDRENITVDLTGEELLETVSKTSNDTATDINEKKVPSAIGRQSRKRALEMLVAVQESDAQEKQKGSDNSRRRRRSAKNTGETIRKELTSNDSDLGLINNMDKNVSVKNKTIDDTKASPAAAGQSSLKRLHQDNNEIGVEISVKKPRTSNEIRNSKEKDQSAQENGDSIKSLNYVRKFFQRDAKDKLVKITQRELEELLIQKIVETMTMRGEIGRLREQAKISERNQEAMRVKCLHLARQLKDLELVLNHSISERRSNNEKIVAPIKINRSVGLQVNFSTDGTMHNLRQLQQLQQLQQTVTPKPALLPNRAVTPIPDPPEAPIATTSVPRRGLKVRSPRRIDVPSSGLATPLKSQTQTTPIKSQTQTTQAAVSSVATPTALIIGKSSDSTHSINTFSDVATTASSVPKINKSPHTATPQGIILNGKLPSPVNRQVATGNFKKTVTNNDLIDLTDEEEKSKSIAVTQNSTKTAAIEPEVTIAPKSQTRYQKVLPTHQVLPGNVAIAAQQTNIRLMTPPVNNPTPTALMNNMQNTAPRVTYYMHGTGQTRQIVLAPNPPQVRQPSPNTRGPVSSVTYKAGVTQLENGMRLLAPSISNVHLLKHPAPLPDVRNNPSNPSWKLPPPAPSLKITKVLNGIVLSWNMNLNDTYAKIVSYQLYAYQELSNVVPNSNLWKKVGDVRALQLPMACTLTQFSEGNNYYFAVRAVDAHSRLGQYSLPGNISL